MSNSSLGWCVNLTCLCSARKHARRAPRAPTWHPGMFSMWVVKLLAAVVLGVTAVSGTPLAATASALPTHSSVCRPTACILIELHLPHAHRASFDIDLRMSTQPYRHETPKCAPGTTNAARLKATSGHIGPRAQAHGCQSCLRAKVVEQARMACYLCWATCFLLAVRICSDCLLQSVWRAQLFCW